MRNLDCLLIVTDGSRTGLCTCLNIAHIVTMQWLDNLSIFRPSHRIMHSWQCGSMYWIQKHGVIKVVVTDAGAMVAVDDLRVHRQSSLFMTTTLGSPEGSHLLGLCLGELVLVPWLGHLASPDIFVMQLNKLCIFSRRLQKIQLKKQNIDRFYSNHSADISRRISFTVWGTVFTFLEASINTVRDDNKEHDDNEDSAEDEEEIFVKIKLILCVNDRFLLASKVAHFILSFFSIIELLSSFQS